MLAAGVRSPELIERWRQTRELQPASTRDPRPRRPLEVRRPMTKVRHNGLRPRFPMTFRLLHVAGLRSRSSLLRPAGPTGSGTPPPLKQGRQIYIDFLKRLARSKASRALATLGHGATRARAGTPPEFDTDSPAATRERRQPPGTNRLQRARIRGEIILHEMRCDPGAVVALLRQSVPLLREVPLETAYFATGDRTRPGRSTWFQLNDSGIYALSCVDGFRSASDLNRLLGGGRRPTRTFLELLGELGATGVLHFGRPRDGVSVPLRRQSDPCPKRVRSRRSTFTPTWDCSRWPPRPRLTATRCRSTIQTSDPAGELHALRRDAVRAGRVRASR